MSLVALIQPEKPGKRCKMLIPRFDIDTIRPQHRFKGIGCCTENECNPQSYCNELYVVPSSTSYDDHGLSTSLHREPFYATLLSSPIFTLRAISERAFVSLDNALMIKRTCLVRLPSKRMINIAIVIMATQAGKGHQCASWFQLSFLLSLSNSFSSNSQV